MTRRDYIETSYVNGVRNEDGTEAIRPMTEEEKAWLSQFVSETDHGTFKKGKRLKEEETKLRKLKTEYRGYKRKANIEEMERLFKEVDEQYNLVLRLREETNAFYVTDEERHELFNRDYERRMDVYNNAKINDNLILYGMDEYDKFTTEAVQDVSPEDLIMNTFIIPRTKPKKPNKP